MFNSITGILTGRRTDSVWIRTGGVEWDIFVPSRSSDDFGPPGSEATVYTWLHHYEDGMRLFGFATLGERSLFLDLMKVEGIGPRQAIKVLSGLAPDALETALEAGDLATLQRIPGVGPKLAQKMVLALKGRLVEGLPERGKSATVPPELSDLARALADMGFDRRTVESVLRARAAEVPAGPDRERELFRVALMDLSTGGAQ